MKYFVLVLSVGLILAQTVTPAPVNPTAGGLPDYVAHTGLAGMFLWFWNRDRTERAAERTQDRADRTAERTEHDKRYSELAQDFRRIVTDNTLAMVSLRDAIKQSGAQVTR